jgi:hypothetical protein
MSTQVQFRRGTTTQNNAFTGAAGEISVDTDLKTIRLHDGTTAGGGSTMLNNTSAQTALNKTFSTGSVWQGTAVGLAYGGTGSALTAVAGAIPYSTANGLGLTAAGTSGQILVSGGINAPTWVPTSSISAGSSTLATTATNIAGGSAGQLIIQADTGLSTFITAGPIGTFLKSAGAGYAPQWATADVTIGSTVIDLGSSTTSLAGLNILAATGTSHWTLPVGTTAQRPVSPAIGMVRYNSSQATFEGYSSGAWSSLGGVKSVDAFTYIQAETSAGASNGDLDFFAENSAGTGTTQVGQWNRLNLKDYTGTIVGTQTTQNIFNTIATTVNAYGAATALTIGGTSGTATIRNTTVAITNNATVGGTLAVTGNSTLTGDLAVNGGDVTTTSGTATLFNTGATTLNIGGAATTVSIGAATGTLTLNNANTVITGNLTVNGTTTTINSTVTSVDDIEFELGAVATPTDITANGGGIRLKGATDKTINWSSLGWTSSEDFNLVTGKVYEINGTNVLDASSVLGAATTATVAGAATALTIGATSGTATIRNSTVAITNAATIGSTLGVTGAATLSSTLSVSGLITSTSGISGGPATHTTGSFSSTLAVTGTSTFTGATTHNGGLGATSGTFSTTLGVTGNTTIGGTLGVTGATTISNTLAVTGGGVTVRAAATQDGIELRGRAGGTGNWEAILTPTTLTADRTFTFPDVSGTVVTTGDTGTVTSAMIADGTIVNADINASAAIAITKLAASTISGVSLGGTLATLTMNVSGTGLSGSTTYNGSGAATFTVASNATSANTGSAIVARDGSGNFSAGTITAALSGNATTATTLQTARTIGGVSFNGSANIDLPGVNTTGNQNTTGSAATLTTGRTIALTGDVTYTSGSFNGSGNVTGTATLANSGVTAGSYTFSNITVDAKGRVTAASSNTVSGSSANTANTLVQRDGSGNFSAGTITAAVFQTSSDARLKTNIENSSYGLSEVLQLRSVKYNKNNKVEIGLIAQEVETVLPEFVGEGDDGMKTVNYGQMVSVLVKAVQDLQAEVASLKAKLGE